jgi:hypothetical protein
VSSRLLALDLPFMHTGINTPPEAAIALLVLVYAVAA